MSNTETDDYLHRCLASDNEWAADELFSRYEAARASAQAWMEMALNRQEYSDFLRERGDYFFDRLQHAGKEVERLRAELARAARRAP